MSNILPKRTYYRSNLQLPTKSTDIKYKFREIKWNLPGGRSVNQGTPGNLNLACCFTIVFIQCKWFLKCSK